MTEKIIKTRTKAPFALVVEYVAELGELDVATRRYVGTTYTEPELVGYAYTEAAAEKRIAKMRGRRHVLPVIDGKVHVPTPEEA